MSQENLKERIEKIQSLSITTDWEQGFCESIKASLEKWGKLSVKQHNLFQKIEAQYTEDKLKEFEKWNESFTDEMRAEMRTVATYYLKNTHYFSEFCRRALEEDNYVPPPHIWNKVCRNKYSMQVIENAFGTPIFQKGSFAKVRANAPGPIRFRNHQNKLVLIIEHSKDIKSPAQGARPVKVLPIGNDETFWTEERYLKKVRK